MEFAIAKADLVRDIFVRTADENYIAARWCSTNSLQTDFLWLAVHALEKYLKSALLLNGKSAKGYGHDIVGLYADLKNVAEDLLPDMLKKPQNLDIWTWRDMAPEEFVGRLLRYGNADNRYLLYGYVNRPEYIHMLDEMVFSIRRLSCDLDARWLSRVRDAPKLTNREYLKQSPNDQNSFGMPLDELVRSGVDSDVRNAALNLNFFFAPPNFAHVPAGGKLSSRNPAIVRRILDPLKSEDPAVAKDGVALGLWFLENVQVPGRKSDPGIKQQIEEAIESARLKHGLS